MVSQCMEVPHHCCLPPLIVLEYTKKAYLVLYNTFQWFSFMMIVGSLFGLAVKQGYGAKYGTDTI